MNNILKGIIITAIAIPVSIIGTVTVGKVIELRKNKNSKKNTKKKSRVSKKAKNRKSK